MTLLEWIQHTTNYGLDIRLPSALGQELHQGEQGNFLITHLIPKDEYESRKEAAAAKARDIKLQQNQQWITMTALNAPDPETFYRKCFRYAPMSCRNGAYNEQEWTTLLTDIVLEIANKMSSTAYRERNFKGSTTIITMLQTRVSSWQKQAKVALNKETDSPDGTQGIQLNVTIN